MHLNGAESVLDALRYEPSFNAHASIGGSTTLSLRGYTGNTASARGKALLFDNIPLNSFAFGTALYSKSFLSLSLLNSIEMVRGPISSFYGPDAFHGAIAMTPWLSQKEELSSDLTIDSQGKKQFSLQNQSNRGEFINTTALNIQNRENTFNPENITIPLDYEENSYSLYNKLSWNQNEFGILLNKADTTGFYDIFSNSTTSAADDVETSLFYYKSNISL